MLANATGGTDAVMEYGEMSRKEERQVVLASTLGTIFEWYDFFIYGSLAVFMSSVLFPPDNPTAALLAALGALAAGFVIRPFGAIVFGYLGDSLGRKYTFLLTVIMMGGSTVLVGCLPSYAKAGNLSWILLLCLRLIQGLAVGGEYGGAVVYVAEHCKPSRRGLLTGWIQITSSVGLIVSLIVILTTEAILGMDNFKAWGWRVPFVGSLVMLVISIYIRSRLHESPVFARMKEQGQLAKNPVRETFLKWPNLKMILLALVGVTAGQGATYFTGQFYVMIFLQQAVLLDQASVYKYVVVGFLIGAPAFIFFGWLSDRIGRKWIMVAGLVLGALTYRPMFTALVEVGNPALVAASRATPVRLLAAEDTPGCESSLSSLLVGSASDNAKSCVQAKKYLVSRGISFEYATPSAGTAVSLAVNGAVVDGFDKAKYDRALTDAGFPHKADPAKVNSLELVLILVAMTIVVAMVYGPVASYLVELFPPQIRYTALSFPYHIGAGIFGGVLPFVATYLSIARGNILAGIWYPVTVMALTAIVGACLLPNRRD
jgi:MFS family permease